MKPYDDTIHSSRSTDTSGRPRLHILQSVTLSKLPLATAPFSQHAGSARDHIHTLHLHQSLKNCLRHCCMHTRSPSLSAQHVVSRALPSLERLSSVSLSVGVSWCLPPPPWLSPLQVPPRQRSSPRPHALPWTPHPKACQPRRRYLVSSR